MIKFEKRIYDASHVLSAWFDHRQDDLPQGWAVANYLLYQVNQLLLLTSGNFTHFVGLPEI